MNGPFLPVAYLLRLNGIVIHNLILPVCEEVQIPQ